MGSPAIDANITKILQNALILVIMVSAPSILLSSLIGLGIGILQAVTQVQEQSLSYVPKLVVVYGTLIVLGSWMMAEVIHFTISLLYELPRCIGT